MSLLQMSVSGALMIAVTVILRALLRRFIPKRTFLVMWGVVILRLMVPYSLPCAFSVYSLPALECAEEPEKAPDKPIIIKPVIPENGAENENTAPISPAVREPGTEIPETPSVNVPVIIWLAGMILCAGYFTAAYIKSVRVFSQSLPAENYYAKRFREEHRTLRRVSVRVSDRIKAPLTYGILRPVVLLPSKTDWSSSDDLKYVLTHEYVHIRRFDGVYKLALIAALCVHWFDPMVWLMYFLANRDIELSCDEAVVRTLGYKSRSAYAMALIRMEENGVSAPLGNGFSQNAIEERIVMIMKMKKITLPMFMLAAILVVGTTAAFATTAKTPSESEGTNVTSEATKTADTESITQSGSQEYCPPLKNYTRELDRTGEYTFIPAKYGDKVYAVEGGTVFYAGNRFGKGEVIIKCDEEHYTYYSNLNAFRISVSSRETGSPNFRRFNNIAVSAGDTVEAGQLIGYAGIDPWTGECGLGFKDSFEQPRHFTHASNLPDPVESFTKVEKRVNSDGTWYKVYFGGYMFYSAEHMDEVRAIEGGTVIYTGESGGYGNIAVIEHDNNCDIYAHLDADGGYAVKAGDTVEEGTLIGYVGNSGDTDEYGVGYDNFYSVYDCLRCLIEFRLGEQPPVQD